MITVLMFSFFYLLIKKETLCNIMIQKYYGKDKIYFSRTLSELLVLSKLNVVNGTKLFHTTNTVITAVLNSNVKIN
jgi:hypothetical protein